MSDPDPDPDPAGGRNPLHASCVALTGRAVLLMGPSGAGKSDLALRLIDRGAILVSDDYTCWRRDEATGQILAAPPPTIAGRMEIRGVGIVEQPWLGDVPVALAVALTGGDPQPPIGRLPLDPVFFPLGGCAIPLFRLNGFEASAPVKLEYALRTVAGAAIITDKENER